MHPARGEEKALPADAQGHFQRNDSPGRRPLYRERLHGLAIVRSARRAAGRGEPSGHEGEMIGIIFGDDDGPFADHSFSPGDAIAFAERMIREAKRLMSNG
jgi:hypothetical protein